MPIEMHSDHRIEPARGTARRVRDGKPADLPDSRHYPVTARCATCGRDIRLERLMFADWFHLPAEGTE